MTEPTPDERMRMHDPRVIDSRGQMVDSAALTEEALEGAIEVMNAMHRWREAETRVSEASQRYMQLSDTDMRAVRYILVQTDRGKSVTAREVSEYLEISSASMTKLLDRLEEGAHVQRHPHPLDRRALALMITEETRSAAEETIGAEYARRFTVAADLTGAERTAVLKFLGALSQTIEGTWPSQES